LIGVVSEWLLSDEVVYSFELEYRLKRAKTCDSTVGSLSNFYRGFQMMFSLGSNGMHLGDEDVWLVELEIGYKRSQLLIQS